MAHKDSQYSMERRLGQ